MQTNIILKYHSSNNSFLYINSQTSDLTEKDAVEITFNNGSSTAYLSPFLITDQSLGNKSTPAIYLNCTFARQLGIAENETVQMKVHRAGQSTGAITVEALTSDDWEILELNLDDVENDLLNQIRVVYKGEQFPVWLGNISVVLTVKEVEPNNAKFVGIDQMTKVNVIPFVSKVSNEDLERPNEVTFRLNVDFNMECTATCRNDHMNCTSLTAVEIGRNELDGLGIEINSKLIF